MPTPPKRAITGFAPILPRRPTTLILGSMPGVASLAKNEYYGHAANRFWPIMASIIGFAPNLTYAKRVAALRRARIAVWDVLRACEREGSADAAIVADSEQANEIAELLAAHRSIRAVFLNGGKAHSAFRKHILPKLEDARRLHIARLPSTSPAHAAMSHDAKLAAWSAAFNELKVRRRAPPHVEAEDEALTARRLN